jgi:urocanate hydratase
MTQQLPAPKAPRGPTLSCKGWPQEAALRLFLNSIDPEISDRQHLLDSDPKNGQNAHSSDEAQSIIAALRALPNDEALLLHAGAPPREIGSTTDHAPALLIALSGEQVASHSENGRGNLHWASRISAMSWFYVGTQVALQAEYEILGAAARRNFNGTLAGKLVIACGLGAVGGAQPLAATLHGAAALGIEPDAERIKQGVKSGYCEIMVNDLDEALRILKNSVRRHEPASVAVVGESEKLLPELAARGIVPDLVLTNFRERRVDADPLALPGVAELQRLGALLLDAETVDRGTFGAGASDDSAPITCIALSGNARDIAHSDRLLLELFPANEHLQCWLPLAKRHVRFQGLPARVVWLTGAEQLRFALASNKLVASAEFQAPMVIAQAEMQLSQDPKTTSNAAMPASPARSEERIESLAKTANNKIRGAFLISIDSSNSDEPLARALIADGTAAATERITRALSNRTPQEGGPDVL